MGVGASMELLMIITFSLMDCSLVHYFAVMHDLRLIHTDLKPENILLVSSDYIKVPDYKVTFSTAVPFSVLLFLLLMWMLSGLICTYACTILSVWMGQKDGSHIWFPPFLFSLSLSYSCYFQLRIVFSSSYNNLLSHELVSSAVHKRWLLFQESTQVKCY